MPEPATLYNAYHTTANLGEGDDYWFNQWMAAYFQMEKISGISEISISGCEASRR